MSTTANSLGRLPHDQELLGDLLHSLSQPLTSLRCSLELSIDDVSENATQQKTVSVALQQTETVIRMVELMREYLDADQSTGKHAIALMPVLKSLGEDLSSIAALHNIRLRVLGKCDAKLQVGEPHLRLALQYLILAMMEQVPSGGEITMLLAEGRAGTILRAHVERGLAVPEGGLTGDAQDTSQPKRDSVRTTMQRMRIAIATRVLEAAGGTLVVEDPGFVFRIPRQAASQPDVPRIPSAFRMFR